MTPQEIADYKMRWKPGYCVRLHSDLVDQGKTWCRRNIDQHKWSVSTWTDVYEHTFHFEDAITGQNFEMEFHNFVKKNISIDPADREWEYDGDGTKIYKLEAGFSSKTTFKGTE